MDKFLQKLESIKQSGAYDLTLTLGEESGCDDLYVGIQERRVVIYYVPVGCLGSAKIMWKGNVKKFLKFDFSSEPKELSNPPEKEDLENDGYFIWGHHIENVLSIRKENTSNNNES